MPVFKRQPKRYLQTVMGVTLILVLTGSVYAQGNVEGLRKMDANGDGGITFVEFQDAWKARVERRFKRLDSNGDGAIDDAEIDSFAIEKEARREKRKAKLCN
jgi:Ca2+-binding EF-hand superfamily protein